MAIRVLIVDDHRIVRQGLALILSGHADITVVGEAANGREAIARTTELRPDVVLLDLYMPIMDGITAARYLHSHFPEIRLVVLTMGTDAGDRQALRDAGIAAYVTKDAPASAVVRAIQAGASGGPTQRIEASDTR